MSDAAPKDSEPLGANVRLRYATLINYICQFLGFIASLFFVVFVTRSLTVEEYGIWTMIFKYVSYIAILTPVYGFWLPRTISRGSNTAKTGLFLATTLGLSATVAFIVLVSGVSKVFQQPLLPLLLACIIVFQEYLNDGLNSISSAHAPQFTGYGNVTLRISQAGLAYLALIMLGMGLVGAVICVIFGRTATILLLYVLNKGLIGASKVDTSTAKRWLSSSWLPIYAAFPVSFLALDVLIVRGVTGSGEAIAFYGIAITLLGLTMRTGVGFPALYARLLATKNFKDVEEILWITYMLAIPITVGIVVYTEPLAAVFNIKYVVASNAIRVFEVAALVQLYTGILAVTLAGLEERDRKANGIKYMKTTLFKGPTLQYIATVVYLCIVWLGACVYVDLSSRVTLIWGIAYLIYNLLLAYSFSWLLRREFDVKSPLKQLVSYSLRFFVAAVPIIVIGVLFPVEPQESIYPLIKDLIPLVIGSALAYFGLLYVLDVKMRQLLTSLIKYFCGQRQLRER